VKRHVVVVAAAAAGARSSGISRATRAARPPALADAGPSSDASGDPVAEASDSNAPFSYDVFTRTSL